MVSMFPSAVMIKVHIPLESILAFFSVKLFQMNQNKTMIGRIGQLKNKEISSCSGTVDHVVAAKIRDPCFKSSLSR